MEAFSLHDALDYCLENPDGLSARELLDRFPEHREDLAAMLGLAVAIESTPPPVPAERRAAMKARIIEAAAGLRPPLEPKNPTPAPVPAPAAPPRRTSGPVPIETYAKRRTPLLLRPGFVTAAAAALLIAFVWWSSLGALPDSPFYNVRIASENFAINMAGSDAGKVSAHLDAATSRLYDLREMQQRDRLAEAQEAVVNYEYHLSSAETLWEGMSPPSIDVSEQLYVSSVAGRVTFDELVGLTGALSDPYRQDIAEAEAAIDLASAGAEQALVQAGRDPAGVLAEAAVGNTTLAELIAPAVPALPVPTEPVVPSTATGSTADEVTPTVVAVLPPTSVARATEPPALSNTPPGVEPPRATPSPPRATPNAPPPPPATHTPRPVVPTTTPVPLPSATDTPVLVTASVCDLNVANVTVTCREQGGVNWFAVVNNRGTGPVTASWEARLEVQNQGGGGFTQVMTVSGTDVFAPGTTNLNRTIQYAFGPTAMKARVILQLDTSGYACTVPSKQSLDVAACNSQNPGGKPERTMTPPGLENKPTPQPREEPQTPDEPNEPNEPNEKDAPGGPPNKP